MASSCNTNTNNNTEKMSIQERVLSPPRPKTHPGSQVTSSNMSSQSFRPPTASAEAPVQSNLSDADKLFNYVSSLSLPASPTPSPPKRGRGRGRPRGRPRGRGRGRGRGRTSGGILKQQQPMEVEGSKAMMVEQPTPEFSVVTGEWSNVAIGQTLPVMPPAGINPGLEEVKSSTSFSQPSEAAQSIKQSILNNPVAAIITEGSPRVVTASVIAMVAPEERNMDDNKAAWNPEADQPSEDLESTPKPKRRKSSGEKSTSKKSRTPKSALSETSPGDSTTPKKKKKYDRHLEIERFPGTKLKICNNCGTVSEKIKAKKCHNCKKFFFDHWARRCKIPPCPTCHYSRKSRQCERVPDHCERCGNPLPMLPVETLNEATSDDDESESVCTSVVSNNSCEVPEEPTTPSEDVPRRGRKRRRSSKNPSNEYDAGETQDETSSMHQSSYPEFDSETSTTLTYCSDSNPRGIDSPQSSSPEVGPPLGKQKAAAVTRSGRVYKQNRGKGNEEAEEVAVMGEEEGGSEVRMSCEEEGSKVASRKSNAVDTTPSVLQDTTPTGLQDSTPSGLQDSTPTGLQDTTHPGVLQDTTPTGLQDSTPTGLQDTTPTGLQDSTPTGLQDTTPTGLQDTTPTGLQDSTPSGLQDTTPTGLQDTTPTGLQDTTHPGGLQDNTHPDQKDVEPPAFIFSAPADSGVPNLIHATTQSVITTTNNNISSKSPSSMFFSNIRFGNDIGNTIPSADKLSSSVTPPINVTNSLSHNPVVQSAHQGLPVTPVGVVKPLDKVQVDAMVESSVSKPSIPDSKPSVPDSKPSVLKSKPSVLKSKPSVPDSKPSVLKSKPSVPDSKPSVLKSKPSVPDSKPSIPDSKPSIPGYLHVSSVPVSKTNVLDSEHSVPNTEQNVPKYKPTVPEYKPTVPESKPTVPESKPTVPESKPTVPESKPTVPKSKPTVPESKPTIPESKPTVPKSKPTVPESKPTVPESKPIVPESKPTIPESKPTVPKSKPIVPESKPTIPESKPTVPKSKPIVPESKPTVPESKPTVPESKPTVPKSKPSVPESKPSAPESKPTVPESKPSAPGNTVSGESGSSSSSSTTTGSPFLSARFRSLYAHIEAAANSEVESRRNSKIPLNKRGQGINPPPLAKRTKFSSETSAFHEVSTSTTAVTAAAVPGIPLLQYAQRLSVDMKPLPIPLASITQALTAPALNSLTAAFGRKYFPEVKLPDISKLLPPSIPLLTATSSPPLLPSVISQAASGESVATQTASSLKANAPSSVNTTKQAAFQVPKPLSPQQVSPQSLVTTPAPILFSPANLLQNYSPLLQSFLLNPPPLQSLPMVTPLLPSSKASITTTAASGEILTSNLPTSVAQKSDNKISSSVKKLPITSQPAVSIKQSTGSVSHATISVGKDVTTAAISRSPTTYPAAISSISTAAISSTPTTSTAAISNSPTTSTAAIYSISTAAISRSPTTSTAAISSSPTTSTAAISSSLTTSTATISSSSNNSAAAIYSSPPTSTAPVSTSSSTTQTSSSYKGQSFQPLVRATPAVLGANNIKVSVIATQISSSPTPILTTTTHNKTSPPALVNISPSSSVSISSTKTGLSSSTNTSKVVYTQTIQTPRVCAAPQVSSTITRDITTPRHVEKAIGTQDAPVSTGAELDTNLQILTSTVQSRIQKALKAVPIVPHPAQTTTAPASNPSSGSKLGQLLVEAGSNTGIAAITSSHQPGYGVPNPAAMVQVRLHPETTTVFIQPETRVKTQGVHFPIPVATTKPSEGTTVRHKSQASNTVRIKSPQVLGTKKDKPPVIHSSDRKPTEIASEKVYATAQLSPSYTTQPQQSQQQQGVNKAPGGGGRVVKATIFMPWKPGSSSSVSNQSTKTQERQVSSTSADTMGTGTDHHLRRSSDVSQGVEMEVAESGSQMNLSQRSEEMESQLSQTESESEGYYKLMSEETLESSESEQSVSEAGTSSRGAGEGGSSNTQKISPEGGQGSSSSGGGGDRQSPGREGSGGRRKKKEGRHHDGSGHKRKRKSSSGGSQKKMSVFSVKLKDCFLHHLLWGEYRMVLMVPLQVDNDQDEAEVANEDPLTKTAKLEPRTPPPSDSGPQQWEGGVANPTLGPGAERRTRRKARIEVLQELEEVEDDSLEESPPLAMTSTNITSPCLSVYELRNKLFSSLASGAVYVYIYKNKIRSCKPPIHWVYVLKRMGAIPESCHTCRLLDVQHIKEMCGHYGVGLPRTLDTLCRNELPKGRKVIDLSHIDPSTSEFPELDQIPFCLFSSNEKPSKKSSRKKSRKSLKHSGIDAPGDVHIKREHPEPEKRPYHYKSLFSGGSGKFKEGREVLPLNDMELQGGIPREPSHSKRRLLLPEESFAEVGMSKTRLPPPLIKASSPISRTLKKKPCPNCGTQVLKKCKKCPICNKTFGLFTFGRRQCTCCGRVNLARMVYCTECGQSLDKAPIAMPKGRDEISEPKVSRKRADFIFGMRKRRWVSNAPPLKLSSSSLSSHNHHMYSQSSENSSKHLAKSPRLPSTTETEEGSVEDNDVFQDGGGEEEDMEEEEDEEETTPIKSTGMTKSKHSGYQYGRIPWGDADMTVLMDDRGVPKFCLQEICTKVLLEHTKSEVFDMVKALDLPLTHGDTALLKKLQALGLHSNRSPICRLIAAEDLWALLDALQEPVPEEVHQHLENINSTTTPLTSPGGVPTGLHSPAVATVAAVPGPTATIMDDDEHGFESTLHEVVCSDGQFMSLLRAWNGEEYVCLPEVWKKYFPEVNRNNLTSVLKRLSLETHMPTGQQATLLRSGGVISLRGAPGRLMRLEDMQALLDDFGIPLQIGSSSSATKKKPVVPPTPKPHVDHTPRPRVTSTCTSTPTTPVIPPGKALVHKEDIQFAECMKNLMGAVEVEDLRHLLERSQDQAQDEATVIDQDTLGVLSELDGIQQLVKGRRELCQILSKEIGFLTATTHGYMAEIVRLGHLEKQVIQELESLLQAADISLL